MSIRNAKHSVDDVASQVHNGVDATANKLDENIDAFADRIAILEGQIRQAGDTLVQNAKKLTNSASTQVQLHPLAAFGVAFLAGVTLAKMLRR